jgi:hypothetical protein
MKKDKAFEQEKKRKLSPREEQRLARFETVCAEMEQKGYRKRELMIGIVRANVVTLLLAIPLCAAAILLFLAVSPGSLHALSLTEMIIWLVSFFALTAVHEGIHGLTWSRFTPNGFRDIDFGFMKQYLTPYCTCTVPLDKGPYIFGALMPLIILGIIPMIIGIVTGSIFVLSVGILMTDAAAGDIMIVWKLLMYKSTAEHVVYMDHPTQAGGVIFEK